MTCARTSRRQCRGGQAGGGGGAAGQTRLNWLGGGRPEQMAEWTWRPTRSAWFQKAPSIERLTDGSQFLLQHPPAILLRRRCLQFLAKITEAARADRAGRALQEMQAIAPDGVVHPPGAECLDGIGGFFPEGGEDQRQLLGAEIRLHRCQSLEIEHAATPILAALPGQPG